MHKRYGDMIRDTMMSGRNGDVLMAPKHDHRLDLLHRKTFFSSLPLSDQLELSARKVLWRGETEMKIAVGSGGGWI